MLQTQFFTKRISLFLFRRRRQTANLPKRSLPYLANQLATEVTATRRAFLSSFDTLSATQIQA